MIARAARQLPPQMPSPPSYQKVNPGDQPVIFLVAALGDAAALDGQRVRRDRSSRSASRWSAASRRCSVFGAAEVCGARRRRSAQARPRAASASTRSPPRFRAPTSTCRPARCTGRTAPSPCSANGQLMRAAGLRAAGRSPTATATRCGSNEVARVYDGVENDKSAELVSAATARHHTSSIQKQPGTNVVAVVDAIKALLPSIREQLPPAVHARRPHRSLGVDPRVGARRQADAVPDLRAGRRW